MIIYEAFLFLIKILRIFLWLLVLTVAFGMVVPYIKNVNSYSYLQPVIKIDKTINENVKQYVPTTIAGQDWSRPITIVFLIIGIAILGTIGGSIRSHADRSRIRKELKGMKLQSATAKQKHDIESLEERLEAAPLKGKSRSALLKEFSVIKKELEKTGRNLAFLAIDVVGSTQMKLEEEPVTVESDFNEYHDYVQSKFQKYGYVKASWTPDGVMACFNTTEQAIQAAQSIIDGLPEFNKSVKMMKSDFNVRCGINSGFVYYDASTPLEEFSDRVIDIAGHMQKHAAPNTILIAKDMVEPVEEHSEFIKTTKIVDSLEAYEWNPDRTVEVKKAS